MRNYGFRLYPTEQQERKLEDALNASHWVYNYFLNKSLSLTDMQFALTELKEEEPWLRNYHSKMLQMVVHKIEASRKTLRALQVNGHKTGKLGTARIENYKSFTYNQSGFRIERHGNTDLLWLSKLGYVQIRLHKQVRNIKQITIIRKIDKWYAIICCEITKRIFMFVNSRKSVGLDVGIIKFSHDSDNHAVQNPLFLINSLKPLRRSNRQFSRRKEDSENWKKAKTRLQRLHERIRNKRKDFLHKTSSYYSERYDIVFLERLRALNMVRNHHLAKHILDSGWRTFKTLLQYKAKIVIEVNSENTSIDCFRCGNSVPKSLAVRIHRCDRCGLVIDRDYNASLNIKQRGLLLLPQGLREVTPVEILCESMKQEKPTIQVEVHKVLHCQS